MSQPAPDPPQGLTALESLAPKYDKDQHEIYVKLLTKALEEPRNRNIALSGPYGTGKSSVLDEFERNHQDVTLRLSISTLAPDAQGATLTNRIQKEVLKQLVYSAQPRTLRHSRFSRRGPMSWRRSILESSLAVGLLGGLLALLGALPPSIATRPHHSTVERVGVWAGMAVVMVVAAAVVRMVTYSKFVISDVAAAGATLKLSQANASYFDEYLDEIIYFFDQEAKDVVIFEDLDRYDDPQIFQALRELNTLLNNTPRRRDKIADGKPLRFIYAMRDSLFEKLGEDTAEVVGDDAARVENIRANRTKFFEVVIPVVPFISHRTAREHLQRLLDEARITGIDRRLVELVAKHVTDMRLLLNMRNEYRVFAERLLNSDKVAPQLSSSQLFALIAYKNFHLRDFENIARRSSDLDRLYDYHRELVATSVAAREQAKRDLLSQTTRPRAIGPLVPKSAERLRVLGTYALASRGIPAQTQVRFSVGAQDFDGTEVGSLGFWENIVRSGSLSLNSVGYGPLGTLDQQQLEVIFPEVLAGRWDGRDAEEAEQELRELTSEIDELRRSDWQAMVVADQIKIPAAVSPEGGLVPADGRSTDRADRTFGELVDGTLTSDLARDLVRHGYIDRNFTLYAAQFYGDFTGLDVATFIVQTVQPNGMDIDYPFTSTGAIANLLAEAGDDFTRTISAYNIQVVDHLLEHDPQRTNQVVHHLAARVGSEQRRFLASFFTSGTRRTELAAQLSRNPWPAVFTYLVSDENVPADVRTPLVSAALLAAVPTGEYDLGPEVADFLVAHYREMPAFTEPHPEAELDAVMATLLSAKLLLPTPAGLHDALRARIVEHNLYELTADSLRAALSISGAVTLDQARHNPAAYSYCLENLHAYLDAVEADSDTTHSATTSKTLLEALEAAGNDARTLERLTASASPDSCLDDLMTAPTPSWSALAEAHLFQASLANLEAYQAEVGVIDKHLGGLLVAAGGIATPEAPPEGSESIDGSRVATAAGLLLNASDGIPSPEDRVALVSSLHLAGTLPATAVTPEGSNLFTLLLEQGLVADEASTFVHLRGGGWEAVRPAILASAKITEFLTPDLVTGMITELFATPAVSAKIGQVVLDGLTEFVPADDTGALIAAARFALLTNAVLPVDQIHRVATASKSADLTIQLLARTAAGGSAVAAVLNVLGGKYSNVSTWEQEEFVVPDDEPHRAVFKTLVDAGLCAISKKRGRPLLVVKHP